MQSLYLCKCDCGNECTVPRQSLLHNSTNSCGCLKSEITDKINLDSGFIGGTNVSMLKSKNISTANKSGIKGVCWDNARRKWLAQIMFKGKRYNLGRYDDIIDAKKARELAEEKIYGEFLDWYEEFKKNEEKTPDK